MALIQPKSLVGKITTASLATGFTLWLADRVSSQKLQEIVVEKKEEDILYQKIKNTIDTLKNNHGDSDFMTLTIRIPIEKQLTA